MYSQNEERISSNTNDDPASISNLQERKMRTMYGTNHMAEHGQSMCEHVRCWTDSVYNFFSVNIHIERAEGKERKPTFSPVKPPSTRIRPQ